MLPGPGVYTLLELPNDPPTSVAAALFLFLVLVMTGAFTLKRETDRERERAEAWEAAAKEKDRTIHLQAEALAELKDVATLTRDLWEALPVPDGPRRRRPPP